MNQSLKRVRRPCLAIGAVALLILLIRTGWAAEDSYISFRVVENFLSGYGLTWNVVERVQVYTDPLFLFILIVGTWISGSVFWTSAVVSLLLTIGTYFLLMNRKAVPAILIGTAILLSSKAFTDFSVSGMENPATHLGVALFCWAWWRKRDPLTLALIASMTAINRLDSLLLFLPALLLICYQTGWKVWKPLLIGFTPLFAWEAFSLFYYGFPFPNTAYAKLDIGIGSSELIRQGIRYLQNSFEWDRVTSLVLLTGFATALWKREWPLAMGLLASVGYVVRIGGDFMSGRFLTAPLVLACAIVINYVRFSWKPALALSAAILLLTFTDPNSPLTTTSTYGINVPGQPLIVDGITDERAFFYKAAGIMRWRPSIRWPDTDWTDIGDELRRKKQPIFGLVNAGVMPFRAGPGVYIIDEGALGDPLLARLPPIATERRPGHYFRAQPDGYAETILTGTNHLKDPKLAAYYTHLHRIISGSLFSWERIKEIIAMNLGRHNHLLPQSKSRQ